jgi:purine-binding chemotaxis protein CheW
MEALTGQKGSLRDGAMTGSDQYGLVRIGAMSIALSINSIREVVPFPDTLSDIPATMDGLLGSINLRGAVVPVLDLAKRLGAPLSQTRPPIIMVVRVCDRVIGIGMDEICGVVTLTGECRTQMDVQPGDVLAASGLITSGFVIQDKSGVILDTSALAHLPGIALAEDRLVSSTARNARGVPNLSVSAGDFHFSLPAIAIEATVPRRAVLPSPVDDGLWVARLEYNGAYIPMVDTLRLLGMGQLPPARDMACVILRMREGRRVALRIDVVRDMIRIDPTRTASLQGFQFDGAGVIRGMLPADPPVLLLDADGLIDHPDLDRLSHLEEKAENQSVKTMAPGEAASSGSCLTSALPYLIFRLGDATHAVPLAQVTEIINHGDCALIDLGGADSAFLAVLSHRGMAIPIIDLSRHLGLPPCDNPAYILLVSDGQRTAGFPLQDLCAVERMHARAITQSGKNEARMAPVVKTSEGVTCSVLDLAAIIGTF